MLSHATSIGKLSISLMLLTEFARKKVACSVYGFVYSCFFFSVSMSVAFKRVLLLPTMWLTSFKDVV